MRKRYGRAWPLASFFLVYLIQQGMLVGLTVPLYAVFSSRRDWQPALDTLATAGCLIGEATQILPRACTVGLDKPEDAWIPHPFLMQINGLCRH